MSAAADLGEAQIQKDSFLETATILIVDDNSTNLKVLSQALTAAHLQVAVATDGETAIEQIKYSQPALILLDVMMTGIDGFETCERLKADPLTKDIPIIFMTALNDVECKIKGLSLGAVDYITKPFQQTEVLARVKVHLQLQHFAKTLKQQNQQLQLEVSQRELAETALRDVNEVLRQQRDLARITLDSIGDGVITTDAKGQIQSLNPIAEQLTGWQEEEVKGQPITQVFQVVEENSLTPLENLVETVLRTRQSVSSWGEDRLLVARDGRHFAIEESASPIQADDAQIAGVVLVFRDVSQSRQMAKELAWQASYDMLTQLVNRREFERRLAEAITGAQTGGQNHCLCFIDLDRFKIVNDICGHSAGDELLRQIGQLLSSNVHSTDTVARLGGDEFAILFYNRSLDYVRETTNLLYRIFEGFRFIHQENLFNIGFSLGLVEITSTTTNVTDALSAADAACYAAKKRGGSRFHVYRKGDQEITKQQQDVHWIVELNKALETHQFCLNYQPIVSLQDEHCCYEWYEVLLRLIDDQGSVVFPSAFIPAAERYGLMPKIDRWVVQTLFSSQQQYLQKMWQQAQRESGSCLYMVNLSGASLNDDQFADFLETQFHHYQIPPQVIGFEITETVAIANFSKTTQLIHRLKTLGCHFALDDFGSGMSSFNYLKNLPVDYLKIDGSLVKESVNDPVARTIVESINRIGHIVGIQTIAEFIENETIRDTMAAIGIDYGQGYLWSRSQFHQSYNKTQVLDQLCHAPS